MKLKFLVDKYGDKEAGITPFIQAIHLETDWDGWDDDLKEQLQIELCDFFNSFFDNGAEGVCHCAEVAEQ
jgi:hypothetical protein